MGGSDSGPPHRFRETRPCHLSYEFGALGLNGEGWILVAWQWLMAIRSMHNPCTSHAQRMHGFWNEGRKVNERAGQ
jgi:hypothetical protein